MDACNIMVRASFSFKILCYRQCAPGCIESLYHLCTKRYWACIEVNFYRNFYQPTGSTNIPDITRLSFSQIKSCFEHKLCWILYFIVPKASVEGVLLELRSDALIVAPHSDPTHPSIHPSTYSSEACMPIYMKDRKSFKNSDNAMK